MSHGRYLIIDGATPSTQILVIENSQIIAKKSCRGNASELISPMASELMAGMEFSELEGFIYCSGPGSALGIRSSAISVKTWQIFCKKPLRLLEYDSFSMCLQLNPMLYGVCSYGTGDGMLLKLRKESKIKTANVMEIDEISKTENLVFLDTKMRRNPKYEAFQSAEYDISKLNFDIFEICQEGRGELKNYANNCFRKWQ